MIPQGQFGAGEQDTPKDHGLDEAGVPWCRNCRQNFIQPEVIPSLAQHGQAAKTLGCRQLQALQVHQVPAPQGLGDELAGLGRQGGDIAKGA